MNRLESENHISPAETTWNDYLKGRWDKLAYLRPDLAENPQVVELRSWISERIEKLPEMKVSPSALTEEGPEDPKKPFWLASIAPNGQILEIKRSDEQFFSLQGRKIQLIDQGDQIQAEWVQPLLIAQEELTAVPSPEGAQLLPVHGFLGVLSDSEGRVLLTIGQEPASENEKHADVILAIQGSMGKLNKISNNDPDADLNLKGVIEKITGGNINKLLDNPKEILPAVPENPNRFYKHNLYLFPEPIPNSSPLHNELEASSLNRWNSKEEVDALILTGLLNGHAVQAIRSWEALIR